MSSPQLIFRPAPIPAAMISRRQSTCAFTSPPPPLLEAVGVALYKRRRVSALLCANHRQRRGRGLNHCRPSASVSPTPPLPSSIGRGTSINIVLTTQLGRKIDIRGHRRRVSNR